MNTCRTSCHNTNDFSRLFSYYFDKSYKLGSFINQFSFFWNKEKFSDKHFISVFLITGENNDLIAGGFVLKK